MNYARVAVYLFCLPLVLLSNFWENTEKAQYSSPCEVIGYL